MARLKAASIINNIAVAREKLSDVALAAVLEPLPRETRAIFERRLYAVEWVEAEEWLPFQTAMFERHFAGDEEVFRSYVRAVCERDFSTFYKVIIRLLVSPQSLLERASSLWSTYSDEGELRVVSRDKLDGRQRVVLRLSNFHTQHLVFGLLLHAFVEQLLGMSGARAVEVSRAVNQLANGGIETELVATYR